MIGPRKLYAAFEAAVQPQLTDSGFVAFEPGSFQRQSLDGEDVVIVDPNPKRGRFSVLLGFYPTWTDTIAALCAGSAQRGFPCGPYLSPVGVGRREHFWSCKTPEALDRSLRSVAQSLAGRGLPWLAELRNPRKFAASVDPVAALYANHEPTMKVPDSWTRRGGGVSRQRGNDMRKVDQVVLDVLQRRLPPADGVREVLLGLEGELPGPVLRNLESIDFASDVAGLTDWLTSLLTRRPPKPIITQFWFGLFHPAWLGDDRLHSDIFIEGREIEEQPKTLFARLRGSFYWPRGRYPESAAIDAVTGALCGVPRPRQVECYDINQCYLTLFVQHYAATNPSVLLGSSASRVLFTQFESSVVKVGAVDSSGFRPDLVPNYWNF